jgi:hypothetical protein
MVTSRKGKIDSLCLLASTSLLLIQIPGLKSFSPLFFIIAGILLSLALYQSFQQTKAEKHMGLVILIGVVAFLITLVTLLILRPTP